MPLCRFFRSSIAVVISGLIVGLQPAHAANILLLTKSSAFEHSLVKGDPSPAESAFAAIAADLGHTLTATKDASLINAADLAAVDLVIFFTSGDLTTAGTDGETPMGPDGVPDLIAWIENGGGFIGVHSASDTFHAESGQPPTPYIQMLGGEFLRHGDQFSASLIRFDGAHAAMASVPDGYTLQEEWYLFTNLDLDSIHALAVIDTRGEAPIQPIYDVLPYPITWCKAQGAGRVYYTGLAHNGATWQDAPFRASLADAIQWALGNGAVNADPNFVPDPNNPWVDAANTGIQIGRQAYPFATLQQALDAAAPGAVISIVAGDVPDTGTFDQAVRLESVGGTARIGAGALARRSTSRMTGFISGRPVANR